MNKAIYAGSFDPITNGHIDIIKRAQKIFDRVYVCVSNNYDKSPLFKTEERLTMIQDIYKNNEQIIVDQFSNLLVDYAKDKGVYTLIRGLRAVSDFDYEFQMSHTNTVLNSSIETVFLMTDSKYSYLSSSLIKQLASLKADISGFVPQNVSNKLLKKLDKKDQ